MTKEVTAFAREQLLQARARREEKRRTLRAAIVFRGEDLGVPVPTTTVTVGLTSTVTVGKEGASTATAASVAAITGTTPVGFETYTSAAALTPLDAGRAMNPSTDANAIHSPSHHRDAPTSWRTFVDHIKSSSTTSSLLSTQPLPKLETRLKTTKKPLRYRTPSTSSGAKIGPGPVRESRTRARREPLWRYASEGEETAEDKQRAEAEELALVEHHTPITRRALRAFLRNSGPTSPHATSPSTSGTTALKSQPST